MRMQMPLSVVISVGRLLVKSHGVRERCCEEIVVPSGDALQHVGQRMPGGLSRIRRYRRRGLCCTA